jgi:hypothetical protein
MHQLPCIQPECQQVLLLLKALKRTVVVIYTTCFVIIFPTPSVYMFHMILRINSDYFSKQD